MNTEELLQQKVGKIVADNYKTATVLSTYGIDFCCKGGISLQHACNDRNLDAKKIAQEILAIDTEADEMDFRVVSLSQLAEHIVNIHHTYVSTQIPILSGYLHKIAQVHGERHPELFEVRDLFLECGDALVFHMRKEEFALFPYVKRMELAHETGKELPQGHFGNIEHPIKSMEHEHEEEGNRFRRIAELTNNFTPPADACQTYRVAFRFLQDFEQDLHRHIHLENNILFPRATEMFHAMSSAVM